MTQPSPADLYRAAIIAEFALRAVIAEAKAEGRTEDAWALTDAMFAMRNEAYLASLDSTYFTASCRTAIYNDVAAKLGRKVTTPRYLPATFRNERRQSVSRMQA